MSPYRRSRGGKKKSGGGSDWGGPKKGFKKRGGSRRSKSSKHGGGPGNNGSFWGRRWIQSLERCARYFGQALAHARKEAKDGHVSDLEVGLGGLEAKVSGSRSRPYEVQISMRTFDDEEWERGLAAIARRERTTALMLEGKVPRDAEHAFYRARAGLYPRRATELRASCTCNERDDFCKHVAATHHILAEAIEKDPFLLLELRGRTKEEILDALREARKKADAERGPEDEKRRPFQRGPRRPRGHRIDTAGPEAYDRLRAPLPELRLSFEAPRHSAAVLDGLGPLPEWKQEESPAEWLAPLLRAAGDSARDLTAAELEDEEDDDLYEDDAEEPVKPKRAVKKKATKAAAPKKKSAAKVAPEKIATPRVTVKKAAAVKKTSTKKAVSKTASSKKSSTKKAATKKASAKKVTAKKTAKKKSSAKKAAAKVAKKTAKKTAKNKTAKKKTTKR